MMKGKSENWVEVIIKQGYIIHGRFSSHSVTIKHRGTWQVPVSLCDKKDGSLQTSIAQVIDQPSACFSVSECQPRPHSLRHLQ